jgi:hypothetical protein
MNFSKTKKRNIIYLILVVVLAIAGAAGIFDLSEDAVSPSHGTEQLTVHFLDVGQGDAILIQFPNDSVMLVDAGPDEDGAAVISYLKQQGVKKIDYLVATHPHADHILYYYNPLPFVDLKSTAQSHITLYPLRENRFNSQGAPYLLGYNDPPDGRPHHCIHIQITEMLPKLFT